ncbi:MAG: TIGR03960 family B12-binding radical SAM protein [Oscillospiraceae bacterium]|jgi:radical SAM family uncharacterized protein
MDCKLRRILKRVQKPARYTGGEYNSIVKDRASTDLSMALCFPDTYEIGMSNLGLQILYGTVNAMDGVRCERVFAPWGDMEEELRAAGMPLFALESGGALSGFDVVGFSLGYEMAYSNVLNMLELGHIELKASDRGEGAPLVIAGGVCAYNPEPLADFIDLFLLGEGEELLPEVLELYRKMRSRPKSEFLLEASKIQGCYAPSLYTVRYNGDGTIADFTPMDGAPPKVIKRIIKDMNRRYYATNAIVPNTEIVHDRVTLELFRGCIRGCRFCQAGFVCRPVRSKDRETLVSLAKEGLSDSGYEEVTLSSLSTSDYKELGELCDSLLKFCEPRRTNLSLPSLRADNFSMELMQKIQRVRKSGLTFAPEAGTQRLRDVINKNVTEEDILRSCRTAFQSGWNSVKLYFMLGLPTETDEDVLAIAELSRRVLREWREHASNRNRGVKITVSTSCFVPKPHTPFQWEAQIPREEYMRRVSLLRDAINSRSITYNWHDPDTSWLEAVLARGDRRLGSVLLEAHSAGARLDAWSEYFNIELWEKAFEKCSLDPAFYANREKAYEELLPWSFIDTGVSPSYLRRERERAREGKTTPDCRTSCGACGASGLTGGACDA